MDKVVSQNRFVDGAKKLYWIAFKVRNRKCSLAGFTFCILISKSDWAFNKNLWRLNILFVCLFDPVLEARVTNLSLFIYTDAIVERA